MGKKLAEAEARAKQDAAAHEKRVSQLEDELRDARRYGAKCLRRLWLVTLTLHQGRRLCIGRLHPFDAEPAISTHPHL